MTKRLIILILWAAFWATPAYCDEFYAITPSGATEAYFAGDISATSSQLSNMCINLHWTIVSSTMTSVVCEAPMNFGQSLMGTLLMGNSYSTPPRQFYRFNIADLQGHSRVQASGWMELQMAFGQMKRTDFAGPPFHNSMMNILMTNGGQFPTGTTFPNHAVIGVVPANNEIKKSGTAVGSVDPGSPAEEAGIQVGDVITRIAGERIQKPDDVFDGLAKAAKSTSYPVELIRGSEKLTMTMTTRFRDPTAGPSWPEAAAKAEPVTAQSAMSTADEISKFAKLRDDGVITVAEFEEQKQRLLSK